MSKTKLLFELIMYVNTKQSFTAQDVAYEFNISVRTAHRYLMELSEMGVPLYTEPGRNGGYRILNNRVLPPIIFDENEAFSIFFAFQSLKYYQSLPFDIDINSVSRKLYANLPGDTRKKIDALDSVLSFWNKKRTVPSPFLKEIIEAAFENQILKIEYLSKSNNTIREIAPIGIYAYDGFWYMPAFDFAHNEIRLFRIDRILSLENMKKIYVHQRNLSSWLESHTTQTPTVPVRLYAELNREGMRQCRSQPWLEPSIEVVNEDEGFIDTVVDKSEIEYVSNYFFQLGTNAKVIEPREVIDIICAQSQKLLLQYSKKNADSERKALKVLITGMSGTGKSTALERLGERGHRVVDTDSDLWSHWVTLPDGSTDWVWREDAIMELLTGHQKGKLFVAGCKSNQGKFYPLFDHVVLLSAPADVILARIAARENNPYGKSPEERELILHHLVEVEPLLRATATIEIDASAPLAEVVEKLEHLV